MSCRLKNIGANRGDAKSCALHALIAVKSERLAGLFGSQLSVGVEGKGSVDYIHGEVRHSE